MAAALADAVERLRARAEEPAPDGMRDPAVGDQAVAVGGGKAATAAATGTAPPALAQPAVPPTVAEPLAQGRAARPPATRTGPREMPPVPPQGAAQAPGATVPELPSHKHSLSWVGRWRIRRKQRRSR
jgi:hypothetical protein